MVPVTLYEYRAIIVSVYDADTVRADIDLGFANVNALLFSQGLATPYMVEP